MFQHCKVLSTVPCLWSVFILGISKGRQIALCIQAFTLVQLLQQGLLCKNYNPRTKFNPMHLCIYDIFHFPKTKPSYFLTNHVKLSHDKKGFSSWVSPLSLFSFKALMTNLTFCFASHKQISGIGIYS